MPYFPGAKRRGYMYYFVASKDDCGWFCCSNAATVVYLPSFKPAASHLDWPAERKHVAHPHPPGQFPDCWLFVYKRFSVKTCFAHRLITVLPQTLWSHGVKVNPGVSVNPVWVFWWSQLSSEVVLSIEPYTTQIYGNLGYFSLKMHQFVRKNLGSRR